MDTGMASFVVVMERTPLRERECIWRFISECGGNAFPLINVKNDTIEHN